MMRRKRKAATVKRRTRSKKPVTWNFLIKSIFVFLFIESVLVFLLIFTSNESISRIAGIDYPKKDSLQLGTFLFPTSTPTPTVTPPALSTPSPYVPPPPVDNGTCTPNAWITDNCTCIGTRQIWVYCDTTEPPTPPQPARGCFIIPGMDNTACENLVRTNPACRQWCELKPIIYLYPEKTTFVDVSIKTPGEIYISDPPIEKFSGLALNASEGPALSDGEPVKPDSNGWKHVLAKPSGKLTYQGKEYKELFYEIDHKEIDIPKTGIIIRTENLETELKSILLKYGLNDYESGEFLKFWVPKLTSLNKPYILFSVFSKESKNKMDNIILNPDADTRIEVIAYFKGLATNTSVPVLEIPKNPPLRHGFVMVAWGGLLDN